MQVPIVGSEEFIREWVDLKMGIIKKVLEGVRGLSSRHVALYLLRGAGDACRVVYYLRTTPADMIRPFIEEFDQGLRAAFEEVVGFRVSDRQWDQAALGTKSSGIGLCRAADIADAAYLASRAGAYEECRGLDGRHVWDNGRKREGDIMVLGEWLAGATRRYNETVPACSQITGNNGQGVGKQGLLVEKAKRVKWDSMVEGAGQLERARLHATAAAKSGAWLDALPSKALDLKLTNQELRSRVGRRLGQELCEECPCPFCFGVMDRWGIHAESCTAGGDKTVGRNIIRNGIYAHSQRGATAPILEAGGVLGTLGLEEPRGRSAVGCTGRPGERNLERPADVLLCRGQDVRVGVAARGDGRVALDVGVVCPQAPSHLASAVVEPLGAAEEYVRAKCGGMRQSSGAGGLG